MVVKEFVGEQARPWDEWGFEAPFEAPSGDATRERASGLAPSAIAEYESPFGESSEREQMIGEELVTSADSVMFPSGSTLQRTTGATGRDEEHWDPTGSRLPLLATGPDTHRLKLSRSFTVGELVTSGAQRANVARISPALVEVLQRLRDKAGKPVRITSGYRSWARNRAIYQARNKKPTDSQHCAGKAADIQIAGMSGTDIAKLAIDAAGPNLAIGVGGNFAHVDVRGTWTLWTYFKGTADTATKQAVRKYRESARRQQTPAARAPSMTPPQPAQPARPTISTAPPGTPTTTAVDRIVVERHPMLREHIGTPPDLLIRWNAITKPGPVDVVVHFHGFSGKGSAMRLEDKVPISGLDFSDPSGKMPGGRTRPTITLLPRGNHQPVRRADAYTFPMLTRPGALRELVNDAIPRFTLQTGIAVSVGRLILTGHSGGGAPVTKIVEEVDPDEVHIFDGLYGPADAIVRWAKRRIARELSSPSAIPPALRVVYRPGSKAHPGTQPHSEAVARTLCTALEAAGAERLMPHFRVDLTKVEHNEIPRRFGWSLLADSAADLPGVTRVQCPQPRARENTESMEMYESTGEWASTEYEGAAPSAEVLETDESVAQETVPYEAEAFEAGNGEVEAPPLDRLDWEEALGATETEWTTSETVSEDRYDMSAQFGEPSESEQELEAEAFEAREMSEAFEAEGGFGEAESAEWSEDRSEAASTSEYETESIAPEQGMFEALVETETGVISSIADRVKGVAAFVLGPDLRRGSTGAAVAALQRALMNLGFDIAIDGGFGQNTERAVRAFQTKSGLTATGIVDGQTKMAIATALRTAPAPAPTPSPTPPTGDVGTAAAAVAEQEFRRWHPASGNIHETDGAATPILQQYYREGVGATISAADLQSKSWQGNHPWSAVFISWVMKQAGAGSTFRYSRAHYVYVAAAKKNRMTRNTSSPFWAFRPTEVAPQVGDLVCWTRSNSGATYDNISDGQSRPTHCDIVTEVNSRLLRVVGGNVNQNVDAKAVRTLPDGRVRLDGKQARIYAIVRCRGDVGPATGATPNQQGTAAAPSTGTVTPSATNWSAMALADRARYVMRILVNRYGYPVNGAAGLVGNLIAESALIPNRIEGSSERTPMRAKDFSGNEVNFTPADVMNRDPSAQAGPRRPGIGLAQWTTRDRRSGLFRHIYQGQQLGTAILTNMDAQIDYLVSELRSGYTRVDAVLRRTGVTVNDATDEVVYSFEIPGAILDQGTPRRKLPRTDPKVQQVFQERRRRAQVALQAHQQP